MLADRQSIIVILVNVNQAVNLFWTILCFAPVLSYWLQTNYITSFWWFIGVSMLSLIIPVSWLQLSSQPKFYEKAGVKFIRKFVQNGDYFKQKIRLISNYNTALKYRNTIYMYERYHFLCLVFFLQTCIHAIITERYLLSAIIWIANLVYNCCPLLLQQYNFARLAKLNRLRK